MSGSETIFEYDLFKAAKVMLFLAAHTEATAETIYLFDGAELVFKRTIELHLELVEAIEACLYLGKIRAAYSMLRMLLEACANFSWVILKYEERIDEYVAGKNNSISINSKFKDLKWSKEYKITYSTLCSFVHGSQINSEIYKKYEIYTDQHKELVEDYITSDYIVYLGGNGNKVLKIDDKSVEEIVQEHKKILEIKTFDIALAGLMRASGAYSDSHRWWPEQSLVTCFSDFAKERNFKFPFLWNVEKHNLAICRVEGRYR
jgi:hypothetical protein